MRKQMELVLISTFLATALTSCSGKSTVHPLSPLQSQEGSLLYVVADFANNSAEAELRLGAPPSRRHVL